MKGKKGYKKLSQNWKKHNKDYRGEYYKEYKQLEPVVLTGKEYIKILDQIIDCETMINSDDDDLKELAKE